MGPDFTQEAKASSAQKDLDDTLSEDGTQSEDGTLPTMSDLHAKADTNAERDAVLEQKARREARWEWDDNFGHCFPNYDEIKERERITSEAWEILLVQPRWKETAHGQLLIGILSLTWRDSDGWEEIFEDMWFVSHRGRKEERARIWTWVEETEVSRDVRTVSELAVAALVHATINLETAGITAAARFMKEIEERMKQDRFGCTPGQEPFSPRQKSAEEAAATKKKDATAKKAKETAKLHDALSPIATSTPRERGPPKFFDCDIDGASDRDRIVQKDRHRIRMFSSSDRISSSDSDATNKCERRPEAESFKMHSRQS